MATDGQSTKANQVPAGTYFVRAFGGTGKKSGKDFGTVTVLEVNAKGEGDVMQTFCDRDVAERARLNFRVLDRVELEVEHEVWGGELKARVVEVKAA